MDFEKTISNLRQISSSVDSYLDKKEYLLSIDEDSVSEQYIANECYGILLDELESLGIIFHCDLDEILGNFFDAECIYLLGKLVSARELYTLISSDTKFKSFLNDNIILSDIDTSLALVSILEYLTTAFPGNDEYNRLYTMYFDKVTNNTDFIKYITFFCELDEDDIIPDIDDLDSAQAIIENVEATIRRTEEIFTLAIDLRKDLNLIRLKQDLKVYNMDKINANNINKYAWWLANKDEEDEGPSSELSEEMKAVWWKYHLEHNRNNNHHVEYYEVREPGKLSIEDLLNLLANCFEPDTPQSLGDVRDEIVEIVDKLTSIGYEVDDADLEFINNLINRLVM